ncbi:hypothetical protein L1D31_22455, partial [Vibrio sp. Isolate23]|uniref:hypothetical protein n=1 Tax=Vibrio sp. Isolate23 TaxID=2908533 RepID=UPI001EFC55BA
DTVVSAGAEFGINVAMGNSVEKSLQMAAVGAAIGVASTSAGIGVGKIKSTDSRVRPQLGADSAKGGYVNKVHTYTSSSQNDALVTFIDQYKGNPRLNISGHGSKPDFFTSGRVALGDTSGTFYKASELLPKISQNYDLSNISSIRVLACHSGDNSRNSFAAQLNKLTGLPVKGYKGAIYTPSDHRDFNHFIRERGNVLNKKMGYEPVWFRLK